jgi:hypothetical protein
MIGLLVAARGNELLAMHNLATMADRERAAFFAARCRCTDVSVHAPLSICQVVGACGVHRLRWRRRPVTWLARDSLASSWKRVSPSSSSRKPRLASAVVRAAITHPSFELCSAPCKTRRFAPPTRVSARGLRALTAPARSSPDCNCVMATPCVSSRTQATPVSGNRSRMRSIGSEGKTSATAQPPGRKDPRPSAAIALSSAVASGKLACRSPRPGRGQATGARPQALRFMPASGGIRSRASQSSVTFRAQGPGAQTNNPSSPEEACRE